MYLRVSQNLPHLVSDHLENIHSDSVTVPLGWDGRVGELSALNFQLALLAMKEKLAPEIELSEDAYARLVVRAVNEFPENKTWGRMPYVYGIKPLNKVKGRSV